MKIETKQAFTVIGLKMETTVPKKRAEIPRLWTELMKHPPEGGDYFGISFDYDLPERTFSYLAGRQSDGPVPDGMVSRQIRGGRYAVFEHRGPLDKLDHTYMNIYAQVKAEGIEAERFVVERYDERFKEGDPKSVMEVWVPVR